MTYTFAVSRRSLPVRCLCVLLCLLVLWCFFMVPRAGAVVAEAEIAYWGGAIVVSVLAAGGLALASGDAAKIGPAMYTALKDTGGKAWDSIQAMAAWAASAGSKVKDAAFRVGADVWQAITDCFNKSYPDGAFSAPLATFSVVTYNDAKSLEAYFKNHVVKSLRIDNYLVMTASYIEPTLTFTYTEYNSDGSVSGPKSKEDDISDWFSGWGKACDFGLYCEVGSWVYFGACAINGDGSKYAKLGSWGRNLPLGNVSVYDVAAIPVSDLAYPGDDYLVKAPDLPTVDTNTGAVSWPSDAVWTKDAVAAPYPVGDDGVKVPDIPFDVPVDGTTGKALDDAGTDTDNPSKPGKGEGAETGTTAGLIGSIIELLKNFFDSPSDFRLNLDGFKNLILPDRFPFSIPFDMVKAVKLFAAAAADFVFRIDLDTQYFSVHHTVDLTPYAVPIAFFRYACVFWFAWILISRTHDLIKW